MGVSTKAIVKADINEVVKTFELIGKREGFTVKFEEQRYKECGFSYILLPELGRGVTVYDINRANRGQKFSDLVKEGLLPKNGRTLKNAKNGIVVSLGSDEKCQKLLYTFLKEFPTHGYLQLRDTQRGGFIYVDKTGFVKTNKERSKQELNLVHYFHSMPNSVKTNTEEFSKEKVEDIDKVYYKYSYDKGEVLTYNAGRKLIDELVIIMKNGEVYLITGTEFRDLRNPKSYYTPPNIGKLTKLPKAKDIGKRNFEDIFTY